VNAPEAVPDKKTTDRCPHGPSGTERVRLPPLPPFFFAFIADTEKRRRNTRLALQIIVRIVFDPVIGISGPSRFSGVRATPSTG
jgi:hypothetical protein